MGPSVALAALEKEVKRLKEQLAMVQANSNGPHDGPPLDTQTMVNKREERLVSSNTFRVLSTLIVNAEMAPIKKSRANSMNGRACGGNGRSGAGCKLIKWPLMLALITPPSRFGPIASPDAV